MALQKCHECGKDVSSEASACPHCGAPVKKIVQAAPIKKEQSLIVLFGGGFILLCVVLAIWGTVSKSNADVDKPEAKVDCAKDNLECLANKGIVGAGVYCKSEIEKLARHSVKWTNGTFEMKFSRFKWADKDLGIITYIGDRAEFQNGFGAFTPMTYECDMIDKTVVGVRAKEGRLP